MWVFILIGVISFEIWQSIANRITLCRIEQQLKQKLDMKNDYQEIKKKLDAVIRCKLEDMYYNVVQDKEEL